MGEGLDEARVAEKLRQCACSEKRGRKQLILRRIWKLYSGGTGRCAGADLEGVQGQIWKVCRGRSGRCAGADLEGVQGQIWKVCRGFQIPSQGPMHQ